MSKAMAASGGDRDQKIREVAYLIWMEEGCPNGRDLDHWVKASERVAMAEKAPVGAPAKPASARPAPAKATKPKAAAIARPRTALPKR